MPTYDYVCDGCDNAFELFQSITAPKKRKCPKCGKNKLRRLIGMGAAIMFKGSGFYQTDYRSDSYKKKAEADKPAASTSDGKSESKSESKSEGKSENKSREKSDSKSESSSGGKSSGKSKSAQDKK